MQKIEILFKQKGIDNPEKERKAKMSMQTQSIAKPFCKVCHDAGKTVAEYSTHYVRESRGGAVVCPTILNQKCNYCKKHGHTPSHCPALQAKQGQAKQGQAKQVQAKQGQAHEAKQVQAKQVQAHEAKQVQAHEAKQVQAQARLCELPQMENNILVPVIKLVALKMNSWASVVSKKPAPAQEEQEQAQAQEQAQEEQAQAQEEQEQEQAQEEQAQRAQAQAQEQAQRAQAQRAQAPEEQEQEEQAQEAQEQAQEQAPQEEQAFNYSNMAWADVE